MHGRISHAHACKKQELRRLCRTKAEMEVSQYENIRIQESRNSPYGSSDYRVFRTHDYCV